MRLPWSKALLAGLAGTFFFDVTGFAATSLMGDPTWWDIPALLAGKLGLPFALGVAAHYTNGIVLAVIYAAVAPSLWGSTWARAFVYTTAETVLGVWLFMAPLLDMGIAGWAATGPMFAILSLLRHWTYGAALAYLIPVEAASPAVEEPALQAAS